jgi:glycosyltransferase involved in cell wall biosynthesis
MKVLMLRNVSEEKNLSMKLYADRLSDGLAKRCAVKNIYPWNPPYAGQRGLKILNKGMDYIARYGVYPSSLLPRRADVFHIIDHANAHLLACLPSSRSVVTCHDVMLLKLARGEFGKHVPLPLLASKLLKFSLRFLRNAARVITTSQATADDLIKFTGVNHQRIRVVQHGIDPQFKQPPNTEAQSEARLRWGLAENQPVLLHVGNNWFYKNLEGLIKALAVLQAESKINNLLLLKVGKRLTTEQRSLALSLGVEKSIREVGLLDNEELQSIYWASDLLVFPSLWEGFGWPPLEAMASGTPVVCSRRGALDEVVGDAAVIVNPEEPESIAAGIISALNDEHLRQSLIQKGLQRAKLFTWERTAEQTFQVYREVAG